eukprot:5615050-Prorocentrum_lima.AAC.1
MPRIAGSQENRATKRAMASAAMRRMSEERKVELVRRHIEAEGGSIGVDRRLRAERYLQRQDAMQEQEPAGQEPTEAKGK